MKYIHIAISALLACTAFCSCRESKFKIEGDITDASGKSLVLEKSDFHGNWIAVDSTKVGDSGHFSISSESPASPEIYRLSMGDRFIYFPVDSIESLNLKTTEKGFGHTFSLTGSANAEQLAAFEKELMGLSKPDSAALATFKRNVYTKYIQNGKGSIVSYYVLTKFFDNKPLYNPENPEDAKYYAAVATQFDNYRPNDPHGKMVHEVSLEAMRRRNSAQGKKTMIQANETGIIDISLPDASGNIVKLSQVVGKGKQTVVIFSMMNENESPAFNRELARIYESHKGAVEFYQISFDSDQYEWREAARNLPWINVIDPNGTSSTAIADYNVTGMPAIFLYNASGELTDRPASLKALENRL